MSKAKSAALGLLGGIALLAFAQFGLPAFLEWKMVGWCLANAPEVPECARLIRGAGR